MPRSRRKTAGVRPPTLTPFLDGSTKTSRNMKRIGSERMSSFSKINSSNSLGNLGVGFKEFCAGAGQLRIFSWNRFLDLILRLAQLSSAQISLDSYLQVNLYWTFSLHGAPRRKRRITAIWLSWLRKSSLLWMASDRRYERRRGAWLLQIWWSTS